MHTFKLYIMGAYIFLILLAPLTHSKSWFPTQVDVWTPPFNLERIRTTHLYQPLTKATSPWNICVLIPHLKDAYWLAVNYGLVDEAKRLGVNLSIHEAGGYDRLEIQRSQLNECIKKGFDNQQADGVVLAAISAKGLNNEIESITRLGIPVVDLINGISSTAISGRAAVDFYDTGYQAGEYLKGLTKGSTEQKYVAWFPGPQGAGWVAEGDKGLKASLKGSNINIVATINGDTGKDVQVKLIQELLNSMPKNDLSRLNYIVGTAVTAEAAVSVLRKRKLSSQIKVMSYYYGPGVHQGIKRGDILASPTDSQAVQARLSVDMMVRILEGNILFKHIAPKVKVIDRTNQRSWDTSTTLAPRGFRAIFSVRED